MPHIHTEDGQYDQTASAFIMRTDLEEPKILFHMHRKLGKYTQPAGHQELHESNWQAILHEIEEETGYSLDQLKLLQPKVRMKSLEGAVLNPLPFAKNTHKFPFKVDHNHDDSSYAFIANGDPVGSPAEGETNDFRWLSVKELTELSAEETIENVRQIALFALNEILPAWDLAELSAYKQ